MKILSTPIALTITFGQIRGTVYARIDSPSGSRYSKRFYNVSMEINEFLKGILNGGYNAQEVKIVFSANTEYTVEAYEIEAITYAAEIFEIIVD